MHAIVCSDCLAWTREQPDDSVDLVLGSPPYEDARLYGVDFRLKGQAWVDWAVERFVDQVRICRGPVCWVVEGRTKKFRWSATPALLMADLHRAGIWLRKPPAFMKRGIPGSGGPDWWRNDYEFVICASKGKLPWSDNTATGKPPKYPVGGAMSNRHRDGQRRNEKTGVRLSGGSHVNVIRASRGQKDGDVQTLPFYKHPQRANPGNVIHGLVGGGHMGSKLAHENEAPFPEWLATPFVLSFCPPGGTVYDPFAGSGTTLAVAMKHGRHCIGTDVREDQCELTGKRLEELRVAQFTAAMAA